MIPFEFLLKCTLKKVVFLLQVQEWRQKAISSESKGRELQVQVSTLHGELDRLRKEESTRLTKANGSPLISRNPQNETEKRVLICHMKENQRTKEDGRKQWEGLTEGRKQPDTYINRTPNAPKRTPFQNIGNSSFSARQNGKAVFPCHCPQPSKT